MDDQELLDHIARLVEEEHGLKSGHGLDDNGKKRMSDLEIQLDQLWDLLRRREAHEELGQDPGVEHLRPEGVVEHYQQ